MDNTRREFFAKLIASGLGIVPALKKSHPEAEVHKLDESAFYALVIPGISPGTAAEIQEYLNCHCGLPRFIVLPFKEIQIYKLP